MIADNAFFERLVRATGIESDAALLPESLVSDVLAGDYALRGELTRISTEKDDTFRLDAPRGRLLVKVAPAAETREVVDLQSAAIRHIGMHAPGVPVQQLIHGTGDRTDVLLTDPAGRERVMRVFGFIDGLMLHQVAPTPGQLAQTGAVLARVDQALAGFSHPCDSRLLLWDLTHFARLRHLTVYVDDAADRELAHRVFDDFERHIVPVLPELETQVIHGDYSPFNLVVDPASPHFVKGVIDFGDVVRGPLVFEPSVAAANQLGMDGADPWASALDVVRGYREVRPLEPEVLELIAFTAPARLLLRVLIYGWRSAHDPLSRDYARSHSARDWQRLHTALACDVAAVRAELAAPDPVIPLSRED